MPRLSNTNKNKWIDLDVFIFDGGNRYYGKLKAILSDTEVMVEYAGEPIETEIVNLFVDYFP